MILCLHTVVYKMNEVKKSFRKVPWIFSETLITSLANKAAGSIQTGNQTIRELMNITEGTKNAFAFCGINNKKQLHTHQ